MERGECLSAEKGKKEEELGSDMHEMKAVKKLAFHLVKFIMSKVKMSPFTSNT